MLLFKIVVVAIAVLIFFAYVGEKEARKQKLHITMFSVAGMLYLLAEIIERFAH